MNTQLSLAGKTSYAKRSGTKNLSKFVIDLKNFESFMNENREIDDS